MIALWDIVNMPYIEIATIASWVMIAAVHLWFIQYNYYLQDRGRVYEGMCVQFAT